MAHACYAKKPLSNKTIYLKFRSLKYIQCRKIYPARYANAQSALTFVPPIASLINTRKNKRILILMFHEKLEKRCLCITVNRTFRGTGISEESFIEKSVTDTLRIQPLKRIA